MTLGRELQKGVRFYYGGATCQLQEGAFLATGWWCFSGEHFFEREAGETVVVLRGGCRNLEERGEGGYFEGGFSRASKKGKLEKGEGIA